MGRGSGSRHKNLVADAVGLGVIGIWQILMKQRGPATMRGLRENSQSAAETGDLEKRAQRCAPVTGEMVGQRAAGCRQQESSPHLVEVHGAVPSYEVRRLTF
jgi:hypothetical protein